MGIRTAASITVALALAWPFVARGQCPLEMHVPAINGSESFTPFAGTVSMTRNNARITRDPQNWTAAYTDAAGVDHQVAGSQRWLFQPTNADGLNSGLNLTFSPAVPASRIGLVIVDIGFGSGADPYNPALTLTLQGGATPADFTMAPSPGRAGLFYNPANGVVRRLEAHRANSAPPGFGTLVGNSSALVSQLGISTTSGIRAGDAIAFALLAIPSCVRVAKVVTSGSGDFDFAYTNLVDATQAPVTGDTLSAQAGTPAVSERHFAGEPATAIAITETAPAPWILRTAACVDENAAASGNPGGAIGTLSGPTLAVPADAVRPEADLLCTFTNGPPEADLQVVKTTPSTAVRSGEVVSYALTVTNAGPDEVVDATLADAAGAGLDCTAPSATATCSATGGAQCPGGGTGGTVAVADLTGSGVVLPLVPVDGQVVVDLQCTVTASGQ